MSCRVVSCTPPLTVVRVLCDEPLSFTNGVPLRKDVARASNFILPAKLVKAWRDRRPMLSDMPAAAPGRSRRQQQSPTSSDTVSENTAAEMAAEADVVETNDRNQTIPLPVPQQPPLSAVLATAS